MSRIKIDGVRKTIIMTTKHLQMCEKIMTSQGFSSYSTVMQVALVEKFNKLFPPYSNPGKLSEVEMPDSGMSGAALRKAREAGTELCQALGGEDESNVCKYFVYKHRDRTPAEVPIELLTDKHVKDQYFPNKKAIQKIQEAGSVNYEL